MVLGRAERDRKRTRGGEGRAGQGTLLLYLWLKHNTSLCTNRRQLLVELEHMTHQKIQSNRCSGWNKPSRFRCSLAGTSKVVKNVQPFQNVLVTWCASPSRVRPIRNTCRRNICPADRSNTELHGRNIYLCEYQYFTLHYFTCEIILTMSYEYGCVFLSG